MFRFIFRVAIDEADLISTNIHANLRNLGMSCLRRRTWTIYTPYFWLWLCLGECFVVKNEVR